MMNSEADFGLLHVCLIWSAFGDFNMPTPQKMKKKKKINKNSATC